MSEALRPCPFCGNTRVQMRAYESLDFVNPADVVDGFTVICVANVQGEHRKPGCGTFNGWNRTETEAVEAWNRRAAQSEQSAAPPEPPADALREAASALVAKLDACLPYITSMHLGEANRGIVYNGPTLHKELGELRAALAAQSEQVAPLVEPPSGNSAIVWAPLGAASLLRLVVAHWNEFGPECGLDELIGHCDRALAAHPAPAAQPGADHE